MRLTQLELQNFRCYREATVDLERVTVVTGPNDGGKSTLVDAVRSLFTDVDRAGRTMTWRNVRSRPPSDPSSLIDQEALAIVRGETPAQVPSWVLATLDVPEDDDSGWLTVAEGGEIRMGTYWAGGVDEPDRCIVLSETKMRSTVGKHSSFDEWFAEAHVATTDRGIWLRFEDWRIIAMEVHQDDLWPPLDPEAFVHVPGPDADPPLPSDVLRPLVTRRVGAEMGGEEGGDSGVSRWDQLGRHVLDGATANARATIEDAYSSVVTEYLPRAKGARLRSRGGAPRLQSLVEVTLGELSVDIVEDAGATDVQQLGAGSRRAATIAAVELYAQPELVYLEIDAAFLVLEEPEVGLHQSAQHRISAALNRIATHAPHVQIIVVTHSPVFLDAADADWIRVCRPIAEGEQWCTVTALRDVPDRLAGAGLTPRDALLASHVVIVEGESDAAIMSMWAITNGQSFTQAKVLAIPAGGHGPVEQVARVLSVVYGTVPLTVILDNGSDTAKKQRVLREKFGDRLRVQLLAENEIESYFSERAIAEWAVHRGATDRALAESQEAWSNGSRKRWLKEHAPSLIGAAYDVVKDGQAIAALMTESEIAPELRALLSDLVRTTS